MFFVNEDQVVRSDKYFAQLSEKLPNVSGIKEVYCSLTDVPSLLFRCLFGDEIKMLFEIFFSSDSDCDDIITTLYDGGVELFSYVGKAKDSNIQFFHEQIFNN